MRAERHSELVGSLMLGFQKATKINIGQLGCLPISMSVGTSGPFDVTLYVQLKNNSTQHCSSCCVPTQAAGHGMRDKEPSDSNLCSMAHMGPRLSLCTESVCSAPQVATRCETCKLRRCEYDQD